MSEVKGPLSILRNLFSGHKAQPTPQPPEALVNELRPTAATPMEFRDPLVKTPSESPMIPTPLASKR